MNRSRLMQASLGIAVAAMCGCTPAEQAEWDRMWNTPLFGGPASPSKGEAWTIECNAYEGPKRHEMANRMAKLLKGVKRIDSDQVWVEHDPKRSLVYYGTYNLRYIKSKTGWFSRAEGDWTIQLSDEIKRNLRYIRQLSLGGQYPFLQCRAVTKPIADVGPEEWDLRNATGVYTLQVGVTYPTPTLHNYKKAAAEWVKVLRGDGFEAYYFHHPDNARSSVCVGTFGENALQYDRRGRKRYSQAVELLRKKSDFQYNLENGAKVLRTARNPRTGKTARMPNRSFLVKMPKGGTLAGG